MLYATEHNQNSEYFVLSESLKRQLIWIGISLVMFFICLLVDWKVWLTFAYPIFGLSLVLLLFVIFFGVEVKGAKSWISLIGFRFQPSEFAKLATCLALASYISSIRFKIGELRSVLTIFAMMIIPAVLILIQPDAGSAIVFSSFLIMFYRAGLSPTIYIFGFSFVLVFIFSLIFSPYLVILCLLIGSLFFFLTQLDNKLLWLGAVASLSIAAGILFYQGYEFPAIGGLGILATVFMVYLIQQRKTTFSIALMVSVVMLSFFSFGSNYAFHNFLKAHQKDRINVWLQPEKTDPHGSRYNLVQSQAAIGSGGFQGKGFLNGTMTKLNYVPEQSTDFIFSTIGEEQGFIGSFGIILLFTSLLIRISIIGERSKQKFIMSYAYGFAGILFIHYFVNIGMTIGLMPIVGIPLPFISKGGSSLLIFSMMMGILLKMDMSRMSRV